MYRRYNKEKLFLLKVSLEKNRLLEKPDFKEGNANWVNELSKYLKKNDNNIHSSTKRTPIQEKNYLQKIKYTTTEVTNVKERKPYFKVGDFGENF